MKQQSKLAPLNDKTLLERIRMNGPDAMEAAELLTQRLAGKPTDAMRAVWPQLRASHLPVSAARKILNDAALKERQLQETELAGDLAAA